MRNMNERPVCHRAEDLVTYLYGEASAADAQDFAGHLQQCDACRAEFAIFDQVRESIVLWRNEALGLNFSPAPAANTIPTEATSDLAQFVQHERKLSALAALREFFSVSPLWLRGATAFAGLLLCVLGVLAISRFSQKPVQVTSNETQPKYSQRDFDQAVQKGVDEKFAQLNRKNASGTNEPPKTGNVKDIGDRIQLAKNQPQSKTGRPRGLSRAEREQLAADLRLTPGRDDEELRFVFPDEPNQ